MKKSVKKSEPSTKKIVPFNEDAEIQKFQADSESVIETANELQITDTESNKKALDFKGDIMRFIKGIETKRLEYVAPLNESLRKINGDAKKAKQPWSDALIIVDRKLKDEIIRQEAEAKKAAEKELERQEKIAEKNRLAEEEAEKNNEPIPEPKPMPIPKPMPEVQSSIDTGETKQHKVDHWEAEMKDPKAFLQYVIDNDIDIDSIVKFQKSGLNAIAKLNKLNKGIPGLRIWNNFSLPTGT